MIDAGSRKVDILLVIGVILLAKLQMKCWPNEQMMKQWEKGRAKDDFMYCNR
jgi:hypothetical protein